MLLCGVLDRLHDVVVTGAAAIITGKAFSYLFFAWIGIALKNLLGGHYHARGTEATLQPMFFPESLLEGMQVAVFGETFYGLDVGPIGLDSEHGARLDGESIHANGASPTLAGIASDVRACEPQIFSKVVYQ
jgi:hypothetical protein